MNLPNDSLVDVRKLTRIFNNTSATYKFYWFLAILDEVEKGRLIIPKQNLFAKMISNSWYTVNYYRVSFGVQDKIQENSHLIREQLNIEVSEKKDRLEKRIIQTNDEYVIGLLWHFNKNVPFKFLSPWLGAVNEQDALSQCKDEALGCPYILEKERITVRREWASYFKKHSRILRDFTWWNLIVFLQKRNPGIPDIPLKLIRPTERESLTPYRNNYWSLYLNKHPDTTCVFSGERLDLDSYHVDHFIPHSFMPQNQVWNLIPIADSFNLRKSNRVPDPDKYFEAFFKLQRNAYIYLSNRLNNRQLKRFKDEYLSIYRTEGALAEFSSKPFEDTIFPQITVALNNGFEKLT